MGAGVLNDKPLHAFRMCDSQPETDGSPIVLHVQNVVLKTQHFSKALHHLRNVIKGIGKFLAAGRIAMTEPRIIRCNEVILRGQTGQQWLEHPR